jgi:hypothetical protein
MRYRKGSISLSTTRDYPLLRQVLDSGAITHGQLFEFLRLDHYVFSRNAFNNRVLRLVKHGLLMRRNLPIPNHESVYSVTPAGASRLAGTGEYCIASSDHFGASTTHLSVDHSLELNQIHLALKRSGSLVHWMSEPAIRSRNDFAGSGYWKYYDAVVVIHLAGGDCEFALEYERTPKAARHYALIRERIEQETAVAHFLYLVPNYDLLEFIAERLSQCKRVVNIGLLRDFLQLTLALPVRRTGSHVSLTLANVLLEGKDIQRTGSLFPSIAV